MTAWKAYVWIFSVILVFSGLGRLFLRFKKPEAVSRLDVFVGLFQLLLIPGLFGYAWTRPHGPHLFWVVAVPIQIALSIAETLSPKTRQLQAKVGTAKTAALLAFQILLGGPALYALIRYTYFSPTLWR